MIYCYERIYCKSVHFARHIAEDQSLSADCMTAISVHSEKSSIFFDPPWRLN